MTEVKLEIASLDDFFADAAAMGKRLDAGGDLKDRLSLTFENMDGLLAVLTANRWRLLRALRRSGPSSVRALAKALGRDYRGVHADAAALIGAGLVLRDAGGKISAPWSRIFAEMALEAA